MSKVLIRAGKSPLTALTHEQALAASRVGVFGSNSGNILFSSAVDRVLSVPGTTVEANSYLTERTDVSVRHLDLINEEYDRFILPMADSLRESFLPHLKRLTRSIRHLDMPVHIIGIGLGAQFSHNEDFSQLSDDFRETVSDFIRAVLDRSASIGVRGEITARLLKKLGFASEHVHVIGCPSMYIHGQPEPLLRQLDHLDHQSKLTMSYTPTVDGISDVINQNSRRYPESVVVPQLHTELALMLWGDNPRGDFDGDLPVHTSHELFETDRMRFFVDQKTWVAFMRDRHFTFGTRIHGNIASLLARTPAVVLVHDARTLELSEYHGIPHQLFTEESRNLDAAQLFENTDFSSFDRVQEDGFRSFTKFLESNDLPHIFQSGNANPKYDQALSDLVLPGPVHTLMAPDPVGREQIVSRLSWLRQGTDADQDRHEYAFRRPMIGADAPPRPGQLDRRIKSLTKGVKELTDQNTALREQLNELTSASTLQQDQLASALKTLSSVESRQINRPPVWLQLVRDVRQGLRNRVGPHRRRR